MKVSIQQDRLLKGLQLVIGVSDKKHHLPILGNVLITAEDSRISLICSDLEIEMVTQISECAISEPGEITVSSRKLLDICRSLPEKAQLSLETNESRVLIRSGRSRFVLTSLPATDFPSVQHASQGQRYTLAQNALHQMIDYTHFAMAQQDVRYYLNGMLFVFNQSLSQVVATDGHRLALTQTDEAASNTQHVIVPRKAVSELLKLMGDEDGAIELLVEDHHIQFIHPQFALTSKLIEGRFPDYHKVIPSSTDKHVVVDKEPLKQALMRTSILSNEKHKGVRFNLQNDRIVIQANNPDQEEAEESIEADYQGDVFEIGFNSSYLLDVLNALKTSKVRFAFSDPKNSVLLSAEPAEGPLNSQYVVMPLRL